ncbi:hypothetical protein J6S37_00180 [Candidatus Saccharibacteria bacterium]|nr:hypothetical protein [Candidatus Saccharibacteria bacterium]
MKLLKVIIVSVASVFLLVPLRVSAMSCDAKAICPTSIEYLEKSANTEVLTDASINNGKINIDVKMLELGDYIKYKLMLENVSEDEYKLEGASFDNDGPIVYSAEFTDNKDTIAPGDSKEVILTIEYKNLIEDAEYTENTYVGHIGATLLLTKISAPNPDAPDEPPIIPPNTGTSSDSSIITSGSSDASSNLPIIFVVLVAIAVSIAYIFYRRFGRIRSVVIVILFAGIFVSFSAFAIEVCTIEIDSKVTIPRYEGREIYNVVTERPIIDDGDSEFVESTTGVNFLEPSSDTNGKGVYVFAPTKDDDVPIYYYRGAVDNNNLIFGDFCWKIFRTTETEGLKIVYNGIPTNGQCLAEGDDTMVATGVKYNASASNLSYFGYSYASDGHALSYMANSIITNGMVFSNDVSYVDGHYVLDDDQYVKDSNFATDRDVILKTHHYTCFKVNGTECETVRYVYMTRSTIMFYVTLKNGERIEDVVRNDITNEANTNKSIVHETVDDWYRDNMTAYTDSLEDAVWCNDRSLYDVGGWDKNNDVLEITGEQDGKMVFNANHRVFTTGKPDVNCANKNDAFTVSEENGNGSLEYPVGLMTLDEAVMAGFNWYKYDSSSDNYLNNGEGWWLMSPSLVSANNVYVGVAYSRVDNVTPVYVSNGLGGVRPVISLKNGFRIQSGEGTSSNPFILEN